MAAHDDSVSISTSDNELSLSQQPHTPGPMQVAGQPKTPAPVTKRSCSRRFTDFLLAHPWLSLCWPLLLTLLLSGLVFSGSLKRTLNSTGGEFFAINEVEVQGFYARTVKNVPEVYPTVPALSQREPQYEMTVFWSADNGENMFTPQNMLTVYDEEQVLLGVSTVRGLSVNDYPKYCRMTPPLDQVDTWTTPAAELANCDIHDSPLMLFFNLTYPTSRTQVEALTQADIDTAIVYYHGQRDRFPIAGFYMDVNIDDTLPATFHTRSRFKFGAPLRGFTTEDDTDNDQSSEHETFMEQYLTYVEGGDPSNVQISVFSEATFSIEIGRLVSGDFILAMVAGAVVGVVMVVQTGSFLLTAVGMFEIFISYPVALFIYHAILQIEYDTAMNQLALFVLLGIGADDVFVFTDAWKQSKHEPDEISHNLNRRFHWAWQRAANAMLVTSLTTMAAFAMTALSPIPAIARFGLLAAFMVLVNYGLVISLFPAAVILYQRKFEKVDWRCRSLDLSSAVEKPEQSPLNVPDADVTSYRGTERFFYNHFAPFIFRFRKFILGGFLVALAVSVWGATLLEQPEQEDDFAPTDSESKKASDLSRDAFSATTDDARTVANDFFFGVNPDMPLDREGIDPNTKSDPGSIAVDPQVQIEFTPVVQLAMVELCEDMRIRASSNGTTFVSSGSLAIQCLPLTFSQFEIFHLCTPTGSYDFPASADATVCNQACTPFAALTADNYVEQIDAAEVLSFPVQCRAQTDATVAPRLLDFSDVPEFGSVKDNVGGLTRTPPEVTWVAITMATGLPTQISKTDREYWFDEWKALIVSINQRSYNIQGQEYTAQELQMHRGIQTSFLWANHVTLNRLLRATYESILVSYAVAVVCLLVSSGNLIVAMLASGAIAGIVMSITGVLVATGGKLDFSTSICLTILVGLAVDYTVHLAHAFHEAHIKGRYNRARLSLFQMGISVFSGAVTSAISSFFLLFTVLQFFKIFGRIILITVLLAFLWASVAFMASLMVLGPDFHPKGDVAYLFGRLTGRREKAVHHSEMAGKQESAGVELA